MRKMIAGMQVSLDGLIEGPEGYADWVESWSDSFGLLDEVDTCVLGGGMYPGYEQYWGAIAASPTAPLALTGNVATPEEVEYAHFATATPHVVLSSRLDTAVWPNTHFVRRLAELGQLKQQSGKAIYVVGGGMIIRNLIDGGLLDELRLTVHPLLAGPGKPLFSGLASRSWLDLQDVRKLDTGRVSLTYAIRH
jgi:dihydrofolate reductase